MKVLGINGSPRKGGNTDILLDKVLEGAKARGAQVEKVILNTLKFSPCQECGIVMDDGTCKIEDDFQLVYKKIKDADAVVLASPIFFGSLSSQTKMMIDRFQCHWRAKYILKKMLSRGKKTGAFISVEASKRKDFFENAKAIVKIFFATIDVEYRDELLCQGIDKKAEILNHQDMLQKAFEMGEKIAGEIHP